jgi:two-component system cell cycle response regulator
VRQRLTLLAIAAVGLVLCLLGIVLDQNALVIVSAAAWVGVLLLGLVVAPTPPATDDLRLLEDDLAATRHELTMTRESLEVAHREHDDTRKALDDYMSAQPAAGSFERKLTETASPSMASGQAVNPTDTRLLADPETNLFSEAYFRVALDARIASARRHLRPVAVALVEVVEGSGALGAPRADAVKVTGSIRQTLRDADTACRMSDGCFALILEDTPENGAVWTVERIRRNLNSRHGQHTMWAGVACYPAHAFSTDELLDQASLALESAREWKQDRIEVATAE